MRCTVDNALSSFWRKPPYSGVLKLYNSMESYMSFLGLFSMILWFFSESLSLLLIILFCSFETGSHGVQAVLELITLLLHLLDVGIIGCITTHDLYVYLEVFWLSFSIFNQLIIKLLLFSLFLFLPWEGSLLEKGGERGRQRKRPRCSDPAPQRKGGKSIFFISD